MIKVTVRYNCSGPVLRQFKRRKLELAWTHTAKKRRQHCHTSFAVETTRPQTNRTTKNTWRRYPVSEMGTLGFKYNWRKMEAAA